MMKKTASHRKSKGMRQRAFSVLIAAMLTIGLIPSSAFAAAAEAQKEAEGQQVSTEQVEKAADAKSTEADSAQAEDKAAGEQAGKNGLDVQVETSAKSADSGKEAAAEQQAEKKAEPAAASEAAADDAADKAATDSSDKKAAAAPAKKSVQARTLAASSDYPYQAIHEDVAPYRILVYKTGDEPANGEVAYCFNRDRHFPTVADPMAKDAKDKSIGYNKRENVSAQDFANSTTGGMLKGLTAEQLKSKVLSVVLNGYPNDLLGLKGKYDLNDTQLYEITQGAVWYFTDSQDTAFAAWNGMYGYTVGAKMKSAWEELYASDYNFKADQTAGINLYETKEVSTDSSFKEAYGYEYQKLLSVDIDKLEIPTPPTPKTDEFPIVAKKFLDGKAPGNKVFTFGLYDEKGKLLETATNDALGRITFSTKKWPEGIYTIKEFYDTNKHPNILFDPMQPAGAYKVTVNAKSVYTEIVETQQVGSYNFDSSSDSYEQLFLTANSGTKFGVYCMWDGKFYQKAGADTHAVIVDPESGQIAPYLNTTGWKNFNSWSSGGYTEVLRRVLWYLENKDTVDVPETGETIALNPTQSVIDRARAAGVTDQTNITRICVNTRSNIMWYLSGDGKRTDNMRFLFGGTRNIFETVEPYKDSYIKCTYKQLTKAIFDNSTPPDDYKVMFFPAKSSAEQPVVMGTRTVEERVTYQNGGVNFYNWTKPEPVKPSNEPVEAVIKAKKLLNGGKPGANKFEFELVQNGRVIQTKTNDADGNIVFDPIEYTQSGTYNYIVREKQGADASVTYDKNQYPVTVTVTKEAIVAAQKDASQYSVWFKPKTETYSNNMEYYVSNGKETSNAYCINFRAKSPGETASDEIVKLPYDAMVNPSAEDIRELVTDPAENKSYYDDLVKMLYYLQTEGASLNANAKNELVWKATGTKKSIGIDGLNGWTDTGTVLEYVRANVTVPDGYTLMVFKPGDNSPKYGDSTYQAVAMLVPPVTVENATAGVTGEPTFRNTKADTPKPAESKVSATVKAKKTLDGKAPGNKSFQFQLKDKKTGRVIDTATNDAAGNISFKAIEYTEPGVYEYTVSEVSGNDPTINYDKTVYDVKVTITEEMIIAAQGNSSQYSVSHKAGDPNINNSAEFIVTNGTITGNAYCLDVHAPKPGWNGTSNPYTVPYDAAINPTDSQVRNSGWLTNSGSSQYSYERLKQVLYYVQGPGDNLPAQTKNELVWYVTGSNNGSTVVKGVNGEDIMIWKLFSNEVRNLTVPEGYTFMVLQPGANCPTTGDGKKYQSVDMMVPPTKAIAAGIEGDPVFKNTTVEEEKVNLSLSKTVAGNAGEKDRAFNFTIQLRDEGWRALNGTYQVESSSIAGVQAPDITSLVFVNGLASVQLKHGQTIKVKGLPKGVRYSVQETEYNQDGYASTQENSSNVSDFNGLQADAAVKFTNTKNIEETVDLSLNKTVTGTGGEKDRAFNFAINLYKDNAFAPLNGTYQVEPSSIAGVQAPGITSLVFVNGQASVQLKHGQTIKIKGLPKGVCYSVQETEYNQGGYTTTQENSSNFNGLQADAAVKFTNNRDLPKHDLTVSKTVTGNQGDRNADFHFDIELKNGNQAVTGTFKTADGKDVVFANGKATVTLKHGQSVTIKDIPEGYTYKVTEQEADQDGYTTTATGDNGTMTADKTAAFTNGKNVVVPAGLDIQGIQFAVAALVAAGLFLMRRRFDKGLSR